VGEKIDGEVEGVMLSVSGYRGIEVKQYEDENQRRSEEHLVGYRIVRPGQLVVNTMWLNYAGLGVSDLEGHVSPAYRAYWIDDHLEKRFVHHLMRSQQYVLGYTKFLTGVRPNSLQMSRDDLMAFPVLVPPVDEQRTIAAFLDQETVKIDALIEEQRRLIELLKEKQQAIISQVVSKGLNSNVPTKNSGVEWIGNVPAHWSVVPVGYRYEVQLGKMLDTLKITGDKLAPYLRVVDVQWGEINIDDLPMMDFDDEARLKFRLRPGDLLVNEGGSYPGRCAIWSSDFECYYQKALHRLRPRAPQEDTPRFFFYIMAWAASLGVFVAGGNEATIEHLPAERLRRYRFAFPPIAEQIAIVDFLDTETKRFAALMLEAQAAVDLLQERRSALISAAVTGSIDLRTYGKRPAISAREYSSGFAHQLLAAEILDRCNSQRMGRIKLQKLIHLCEYHGQVSEVQGDYSRKAAGPFDAKAMAGISKNLKKQKWFEEVKEGERYVYRPLEKSGEHKKYLAHWQAEMPRIDEVLSLLGNFRTRECEIVSTLYAAWNDLLIDGGPADDAAILHEASSAERWHKSKEQIAPERWKKALQWMKDKGLVPVGYGKHTRHTAGQIGSAPEVSHEPA
jgi:type I restriction enzyme, S subunit